MVDQQTNVLASDNTNTNFDNVVTQPNVQDPTSIEQAEQPALTPDPQAIQQEKSTIKIIDEKRKDMEKRLEETIPAAGVAPVVKDEESKPIEDILSAPPHVQESYINQQGQ